MVSSHQNSEALKLFKMKVMGVKATGLWRDLYAWKAFDCGLTSYCNSCQCPGLLAHRCLPVPVLYKTHRFCSCGSSLFYFQAYLFFFISIQQHEWISRKATDHKQHAPLIYALSRLKGFQDLSLWLQRLKHHHGMLYSSTSRCQTLLLTVLTMNGNCTGSKGSWACGGVRDRAWEPPGRWLLKLWTLFLNNALLKWLCDQRALRGLQKEGLN